eukprot:TRINITY_DN52585_c0_g1_i1.p1 TRINITY_DN52585_c0_g1~~TRINITY_DN52585_c0_g1_i1.p1  ORF type:complete len:119 (-),score=15.58 TRINITY_DN52585_c0_g1_i1:36-392(-)
MSSSSLNNTPTPTARNSFVFPTAASGMTTRTGSLASTSPVTPSVRTPNTALGNSVDANLLIEAKKEEARRMGARNRERKLLAAGVYKADGCLLYTSDAADEEDSVDFCGRRILQNKKE